MTDLTEQWKKGELLSGWYYTKLWKGCNVIDKFIDNQFLRYDDSDIVEVLAPVPSYQEWQRILHYAGKYEYEYTSCVMDYENLKQENQRLKDLLKGCQYVILDYSINHDTFSKEKIDEIVKKIDNAIGEKK